MRYKWVVFDMQAVSRPGGREAATPRGGAGSGCWGNVVLITAFPFYKATIRNEVVYAGGLDMDAVAAELYKVLHAIAPLRDEWRLGFMAAEKILLKLTEFDPAYRTSDRAEARIAATTVCSPLNGTSVVNPHVAFHYKAPDSDNSIVDPSDMSSCVVGDQWIVYAQAESACSAISRRPVPSCWFSRLEPKSSITISSSLAYGPAGRGSANEPPQGNWMNAMLIQLNPNHR